MKAFDRVLTTFGILLLLCFRADAHDPSMPHHEWFNKQEMNSTVQHRLGLPYKSCCSNGDVFKTRFAARDGYIFLTHWHAENEHGERERKAGYLCFDKLTCILCFVNDEESGHC